MGVRVRERGLESRRLAADTASKRVLLASRRVRHSQRTLTLQLHTCGHHMGSLTNAELEGITMTRNSHNGPAGQGVRRPLLCWSLMNPGLVWHSWQKCVVPKQNQTCSRHHLHTHPKLLQRTKLARTAVEQQNLHLNSMYSEPCLRQSASAE